MTALDIITEKPTKDMGKLELAIFTLWNSFSEDELAEAAAAELATLTALLKEADKVLEPLTQLIETARSLRETIYRYDAGEVRVDFNSVRIELANLYDDLEKLESSSTLRKKIQEATNE